MATDALVVPANKGRKLPPELLTPEEVRALLQACSPTAPTGIRNRALLVTLYRAGLRLEEALALLPADVDADEGVLRIGGDDGEEGRVAGIDAAALAIVGQWLEVRAGLLLPKSSPLFCTLSGGPLQSAYVRQLLPRLAEKAGISKRVHASGLRYTHAAELAAEGLPVELISAQLGHESLASTDRYLRRIPPKERIGALHRRQWSP
ncbi:MAG: tyrosine-type recombinase/integrase [Actinomycetota bacterium]